MIGHSKRLEAAIASSLPIKAVPLVDWSKGRGYPWTPLEVLSGQHSCDATRQTRWEMSGAFRKTMPIGPTGINAYGCRLRVRMAITVMGFGMEILPAGVYSITSVNPSETAISLSAASFEADCIRQTFPVARTLPSLARMTYRAQAEKLILEAVPDASFVWSDKLLSSRPMPTMHVDTDRWAVIDGNKADPSIMNALGGEAFCNSYGAFQFRPVPTIDGPVVGSVSRGDTLIQPTVTMDQSNVFNLTVVTGTPTNGGEVIGPVYTWDKDPTSRTYGGPDPLGHPELAGLYGVTPYRYDSPLITDTEQGKTTGKALLAKTLGAHEIVTVDARYNPFYEAGDIVAVPNSSAVMAPKLLDSIATTWGSDKVTYTTRSAKEDLT